MFNKGDKVRCKDALTILDPYTFLPTTLAPAGTIGEVTEEFREVLSTGKLARGIHIMFEGVTLPVGYVETSHVDVFANLELLA